LEVVCNIFAQLRKLGCKFILPRIKCVLCDLTYCGLEALCRLTSPSSGAKISWPSPAAAPGATACCGLLTHSAILGVLPLLGAFLPLTSFN
jgi:hypothetical protein